MAGLCRHLEGCKGQNLPGLTRFWDGLDLSFQLIPVLLGYMKRHTKWIARLKVFKYRFIAWGKRFLVKRDSVIAARQMSRLASFITSGDTFSLLFSLSYWTNKKPYRSFLQQQTDNLQINPTLSTSMAIYYNFNIFCDLFLIYVDDL